MLARIGDEVGVTYYTLSCCRRLNLDIEICYSETESTTLPVTVTFLATDSSFDGTIEYSFDGKTWTEGSSVTVNENCAIYARLVSSDGSSATYATANVTNIGTAISKTPISTDTSYVGYYADTDGDTEPDGVIYADLLFSDSGEWGDYESYWAISAISTTKEYYISQDSYNGDFGTMPVISPVDVDSTEPDRFYVMALEDYVTDDGFDYFYWDINVENCYETWDDLYVDDTDNDFGKGYSNTEILMSYTNWTEYDIWYYISDEFEDGWFVPSKSELACFGSAFDIGNTYSYDELGLSGWYWSSSQNGGDDAYSADFQSGFVGYGVTDDYACVRLTTTF